jgi:putative cell wall-binding protein
VPRVIGSPVSSSQDVRGPATLAYTTTRDTDLTGTGIRHSNPLIVGAGPVGYDARPKYRSPAIDSGTEAAATPATDIRGVGRPLDSDLVAGSAHDRGAYEIRPPALRTYSATRYGQAWGVALRTYPGFAGVTDVVIACGDDRAAADPLAAAGLCWTYDAPLLLTSATTLTIETRSAFTMLATLPHVAPLRVHVVGGTGSVPQARLDDIAAIVGPSAVSFDRITAVGDRYDLAAAIARRMNDEGPTPSKHVALIANGADPVKFFDALALSPIARAQGCPILLVKYGSVPAATASALNGLGLNQRYMAGGPGTILESVRVSLGATRWWGADRYSTAVAVANGAKSKGWSSFATVGVAGGKTGLYDALAGGTMVGRDGGVLLLTTPAALSATTGNTLTANRSAISECLVFGTVGAVSEATRLAVRNKVR